MQALRNTVKFGGMYKDMMKFLLRCTKMEKPSPLGAAAFITKNTVWC